MQENHSKSTNVISYSPLPPNAFVGVIFLAELAFRFSSKATLSVTLRCFCHACSGGKSILSIIHWQPVIGISMATSVITPNIFGLCYRWAYIAVSSSNEFHSQPRKIWMRPILALWEPPHLSRNAISNFYTSSAHFQSFKGLGSMSNCVTP